MNEEQMTQTAPEAAAAPTQAAPEKEGTELNIGDLQSLKAIIDIASQRGAFKATELEAVGKTYNRLNKFLEEVAKGQ
jgi:hypothetical protein